MTLQHLIANSEDIWIDFLKKKFNAFFCQKPNFMQTKPKETLIMIVLLVQHDFQLHKKSQTPVFPPHSAPCVKKPFRAKNNPHKFKTHQGIDPCRAGGEQTSVSSQLGLPTGRED